EVALEQRRVPVEGFFQGPGGDVLGDCLPPLCKAGVVGDGGPGAGQALVDLAPEQERVRGQELIELVPFALALQDGPVLGRGPDDAIDGDVGRDDQLSHGNLHSRGPAGCRTERNLEGAGLPMTAGPSRPADRSTTRSPRCGGTGRAPACVPTRSRATREPGRSRRARHPARPGRGPRSSRRRHFATRSRSWVAVAPGSSRSAVRPSTRAACRRRRPRSGVAAATGRTGAPGRAEVARSPTARWAVR